MQGLVSDSRLYLAAPKQNVRQQIKEPYSLDVFLFQLQEKV